jgi:hypothetical protein
MVSDLSLLSILLYKWLDAPIDDISGFPARILTVDLGYEAFHVSNPPVPMCGRHGCDAVR